MTEYASFEDLTTAPEGEPGEDLTLPSGRLVRVQGITRLEWLRLGKGVDDAAEIERRLLRVGLVAPKMTDVQLKTCQSTPGQLADIGAVTDRIRDLSGLGEGAGKSVVAEVRD
jgi:hypothetical protein